jgi:hypothetical protein
MVSLGRQYFLQFNFNCSLIHNWLLNWFNFHCNFALNYRLTVVNLIMTRSILKDKPTCKQRESELSSDKPYFLTFVVHLCRITVPKIPFHIA